MIGFLIGLGLGSILGVLLLAWAMLEKVKTHDYTILAGRPKWILRIDRYNLMYDELVRKYIKVK